MAGNIPWSEGYANQVQTVLEKDVFPVVGKLPIRAIRAAHLRPVVKTVVERGAPTLAILIRQWCGQIFGYASGEGLCDNDPSAMLKKSIRRPRVRHHPPLPWNEISDFLGRVDQDGGYRTTVLALRLMALTYVRTVELRKARWREFDLDNATWVIPAERMKMREPHVVPLSKQAIGVLKELHGLTGGGDVLFPSYRKPGQVMSATTLNKALETDRHLAMAEAQATPGCDPGEVVAAHVRRLEALRRAGLVERVADGLWKVPDDLAERGRRYDARRLGGIAVELKSPWPIERQARAIGATWLDQQLIGGGKGLGDLGFGSEVKDALQRRTDFLVEQGLAERRGQRIVLARNLLANAARPRAGEGGAVHRSRHRARASPGRRRPARGRHLPAQRHARQRTIAMLDDGIGFSLVPWRPVIEPRLGQHVAATLHGNAVSWRLGRQRGPAIG